MSPVLMQSDASDVPFLRNRQANRSAAWTEAQDAILNDQGLLAARDTISGWPGYRPTRLHDLTGLADELGISALHYKDESTRFGLGSFKALGGAYAVARLLQAQLAKTLGRRVDMDEVTSGAHPERVAKITVCCATDGNHGRSVAWGAQTFGCACVIFIHATVSEHRKRAIEAYGAEVRRCEGNYDDSVRLAQETAAAEGWFVVSDTSYPGYMEVPKDVMQGYELMADEAFAALPEIPTHVFLQTGVGGMAAAVVASAVRRWGEKRPIIVLCDPDHAACWYESFKAGAPVAVEGDLDTVMAGLACGEVSALAWEILKDHADAVMAVPDEMAVAAMCRLARPTAGDPPVVAGESATAGLAGLQAALSNPEVRADLGLSGGARVLLFGTEGDTDPELYREIVGASAGDVLNRG
ncbi:diaminopropionate ammonia-lyase [Marinibacterium profundimaris]|uniref:Diaminopropionate ammonia-lyase n=1 Tax=Marinibacterium profundimaris TaxID=1679460 RepID=A0A225NML1_9RHOB|nr:diaminopropionate ammonia-lyase [Marinibacterium profundimaris]OWU74804.1 diaminopropionate ammonia-lyase [Marinibacterium profundimaris]